MRVAVTGSEGFVGRHLVADLGARGIEVVPIDMAGEHPVDICDASSLAAAVVGCDCIVHLAAVADVGAAVRDPVGSVRTNVLGTAVVLETAREIGARAVLASTVWSYSVASPRPTPAGPVLDEDCVLDLGVPVDIYTGTKLMGEMLGRTFGARHGVATVTVRLGIPFGPHMRAHALIPQFVRAASQGEVLRIEGDGSHTRPFVYVTDLCDGIARCVVSEGASGVYNLVGPTETSVREIAEMALSLFPRAGATVEHGPARAEQMESGGTPVSGARAQQDLGWSPTVGVREGIHRYAAWHCASVGSEIEPMEL